LIDPEVVFFELRINDKLRVHGFMGSWVHGFMGSWVQISICFLLGYAGQSASGVSIVKLIL